MKITTNFYTGIFIGIAYASDAKSIILVLPFISIEIIPKNE